MIMAVIWETRRKGSLQYNLSRFFVIHIKIKASLKRVLNELYLSISLTINFWAAWLQSASQMFLYWVDWGPAEGSPELKLALALCFWLQNCACY
jgi:hypothetical protein